ncbi:uncharacterized protein CANTADRAFT_53076 [Suhomyces tanzawaensis NRRL Y-17324]|uniref:DUF4484 domain-containing protein n=1 Tax=Suhomyces tanzawaensis NRRL Y-17324 TaxID=984487 RepID=A0A1E4SFW8_9ASCO|nr:uncharacterized protein CANTADRAFT_53076 [Suhomyces tanzawaensis NRRL Y-17324]ODV78360.1 hypothetical protein CANTADRAFT_53076 [Suhomyces tanzawaensis NRRL Y-17324]
MPESKYHPSKVVALFVAQFDIRSGYQLVWSKCSVPGMSLDGLDYKALPSGIHEYQKATVLLSHSHQNKLYYGQSRFRQYIVGDQPHEGSIDRDTVKMFSVGVVCDPTASQLAVAHTNWKPNEFINNGWEYSEILDTNLEQFLQEGNYANYDIFERLYQSLTSHITHLSVVPLQPDINHHLLTKLPNFVDLFGPLIFILFKQSLLRKRVLIFNRNHGNNADYLTVNSFSYILSLLTVIPQNIETVSKDEKNNYYSQPIYNVGLNDLTGLDLLKTKAYVASTNDDVLLYQKNLFDIAVIINDEESDYPAIYNHKDMGGALDQKKKLKATVRDYYKFKAIHNELHKSTGSRLTTEFTNKTNMSTDDLNSVHTKISSTSLNQFDDEVADEPAWWVNDATEAVSWRESIWSAFSWFASAGQVVSNTHSEPLSKNDRNGSLDMMQLVNIVGFFHSLTKKWIYLINEIVIEQLEEQNPGDEDASLFSSLTSNHKISLELTYQDLVDMELDPYYAQDVEFVREFVMLYWGSVVENVDIGMGITGICC